MTQAKSTIALSALLALLAACSSTPVAPPPAPAPMAAAAPAPVAPAPAAAGTPRATTPPGSVATVALPAYLDPTNRLSTERSVYFDFDDFAVKGNGLGVVERHGQFLATHPLVAIKIEGNADERGGSEYNLALGQKRADAVQRALRIYGVKDAQMEAISWGKSKPRALGHDASAMAENRRADLQYPPK